MEFDVLTGQDFSFFTLSPDLMAVLNPNGSFQELNPAWEKALGFRLSELRPIPFLELLHESDRSPAQIEIYRLLKGDKTASVETRLRRKDQTYLWVRWTFRRPDDTAPLYLVGQDVTELKQALESLADAVRKFNRMNESTTEGVAVHDKGVILEANQALANLLGYEKAEELVGLDGLDFTAPEYKQLVLNHFTNGLDQPYEVIGLRRDGTRFNCLLSGKPILYQGRKVRVSTFLDITDLKKREQELLESQELFRKLTEACRDGIAVSEKGKILLANQSLARMFGCEVPEMIGHNALEYTAPEFREALLHRVLEETEAPYEVMGLRKDGTRFPVEITPRMTSYQGRRVRLGFFRDISQRKKIEEEVRRQKEFSQNLINSSIDGLLAFDQECRYTLWNPAMERLTGHSREEVLGQCAFDVFPFLKQIGEERYLYDALDGKIGLTKERPYRTASGRQGFFEAKYMPIKNAQGLILGGLGIFHDVTERKVAEEALKQSESSLRAVITNTFQNIILMDREGLLRAFNQNAAAFMKENTGKDLELGRCFFDYPPSGSAESAAWRGRFRRALNGEVVQLERYYPSADGGQHWFEINYHPVFGDGGEIDGVCYTSICIDDRKKMQEALKDSEANLQALFNSSSQNMTLVGRDGRIRFFNKNAALMVQQGMGREMAAGKPLRDFLTPEAEGDFKDEFQRALKGEVVRGERQYRFADGTEHWVEYAYNPVLDGNGRIYGVCLTSLNIDDRKRAEEKIQKSEADLRAVFESSLRGFILAGPDGKIRDFNRIADQYVRDFRGQELAPGRHLAGYIEPEFGKAFEERFHKTLQGEAVHLERTVRTPDGKDHWFEFVYSPVCDLGGKVTGVCVSIGSIDDRKKAEESLRESEEKFRRIFEDAPVGMAMVADYRFIKVNRAFRELLGYAEEEIVGKGILDITDPADLAETQKIARSVHEGERAGFQAEKRYVRKDGERVWVHLSGTVIRDGKGSTLYSLLMAENITDRKSAQAALRDSEEKFRKFFEDAPLGIAMVQDYRFRRVNQAFQKLLGYTEEELIGKTFRDITHPEDLGPSEEKARALHEGEVERFRIEKRYVHKNGHSLWAQVSGTAIRDQGGKKLYSLIMVENVTEAKKAQDALQKSEADLRAVFNSVSQNVILLSPGGLVQSFNKSAQTVFLQVLGLELAVGRPFESYVRPEDREGSRAHFQKALDGEVVQVERSYHDKDGGNHWVEYSYAPVRGDQDRVEGVCFISQGIDNRKEAEMAVQESEKKFRKIFEDASIGMTLVDRNFRFLHVNRAFCRMLGYGVEELVGKNIREVTHPEDVAASEAYRGDVRRGKGFQQQKRYLHKNGTVLWANLSVTSFLDARGELLYSLGMVENITERKLAEEALRHSEAELRAVFNSGQQGVVLVDREGRIRAFNRYFEESLRQNTGQVLEKGRPFLDYLPPTDHEGFRKNMAEAFQGKHFREERRFTTAQGEKHWVEARYQPLFNDEGQVDGVCLSLVYIDDRKKAEAALKESQERFERLAEVTQEGIMIHANGFIVDANQALARMMGYDVQEMVGKNGLDFLEPSSVDRARQSMEAGLSESYQVTARRKDGTLFPAELQGRNFQHKGRDLRVLSIRDITWRRETERILGESEERYRRLVELSPEAIVVHSEGKVLYVNASGLGMFGASFEEVEGSRIIDFLHPDSREETLERVRRIVETNQPNDWTEQRLIRRDGQVFDAETKGTPVLYQGHSAVLTIVRDITHRKKSETALKESEERYRRLVEYSPEALLVHGGGKILYLNPAGVKLLGAPRLEDLIGKPVLDIVHPDYREVVQSRIRRTIQQGVASEPLEQQFLRMDGQVIDVEVQGIPFVFEGSRAGLALIRDITESKKIHNLLLRYERLAAVGKIIAAIAHEIRNPLAVVSGMGQVLQAKLETRSEFSHELQTILAQTQRLKLFMDDILDFSREMQIQRQELDPRVLMEQSLALAQAQVGTPHVRIEVKWKWEEGVPAFRADGERLTQVLVNLILNAYQAMGEKGTLVLSATARKDWIFLGVTDDGPGVQEADLRHLFEPFFTTKKHGSGLGLSISQKIAEVHGGRIEAKNLQPHGMSFTLQLPQA